MNGDSQQFSPDPDQAAGQWVFRPDEKRSAASAGGATAQPSAASQPAVQQPITPAVQVVPATPPPRESHTSPVPVSAAQPLPAPQPVASPDSATYAPVLAPESSPAAPANVPQAEISWTASEFVNHSRGTGWYALLAVAVLVVATLAFLITRDFVSTFVIVLIATLVAVSAARKPRVLPYHVDNHGVSVGSKFYPYGNFKSFSIMDEGAFSSIMFLPMQRLMPPLSIYYDPQDENQIVETLSLYLPMEYREHDVMDRLARRMRF